MPLLALLVVAVLKVPVTIQRQGSDVIYFTSLEVNGPAGLAGPPRWCSCSSPSCSPVRPNWSAPASPRLSPLTAYRYDLIGSFFGIVAFAVLGSSTRRPSSGGAIVALAGRGLSRSSAGCWWRGRLPSRRLLLIETMDPGVSWSPYYKVTTSEVGARRARLPVITGNGVPHQLMAPAQWKIEQGEGLRNAVPPKPRNRLDDVLVVGAGSGSDVAIALPKGADRVDAVDIDPRILEIGEEHNLDRPYATPRVDRHVNDGRAFLRGTDRKYDLVLFALPDSLTLVSGASQIRLESFLFTEGSNGPARREHLKPDGAFAMYNYYREAWLIDRLAGTAAEVFGPRPCIDTFAGVPGRRHLGAGMAPLSGAQTTCPHAGTVVAPATDDAPFLYFRGDKFPRVYVVTLLGMLLLSAR